MVSARSADSLFRRLLTRLVFERPTSSYQGEDVEHVENPFLARSAPSDDTVSVRLALELEQCWYGPPVDTKSEFAAFWMFGILGTALSSKDRVAGNVQWRAYINWAGRPDSSQLIGRGLSIGDPRKLSLREAISLANRRALYDLATELSFFLNDELDLGLKKRVILESFDEFQKIVDSL